MYFLNALKLGKYLLLLTLCWAPKEIREIRASKLQPLPSMYSLEDDKPRGNYHHKAKCRSSMVQKTQSSHFGGEEEH